MGRSHISSRLRRAPPPRHFMMDERFEDKRGNPTTQQLVAYHALTRQWGAGADIAHVMETRRFAWNAAG